MGEFSEPDDGEIAAIITTLQGIIARLDAMGRMIEGSHISMAVDLLISRTPAAGTMPRKPNLH
jgi:hypothetical protein